MSEIKAYVLSAAGAVLISAVLMMIAPSGKMGKFVRGMTKLFVLTVLIVPFVSLFRGEAFRSESIGSDKDYLSYCESAMEERDSGTISALLFQEFGIGTQVETERTAGKVFPDLVRVKILDFGINGEEGHIDIVNRVQACLFERYGCDVEVM